jgi:thymidylate synthase (FAD)
MESNMKVERYNKPESWDAMVVDMARVSFAKSHENYSLQENTKLIRYLVNHDHWTPLAHPTVAFSINITEQELIPVLLDKQLMAGLNISILAGERALISGSLWSMVQLAYVLDNWAILTMCYSYAQESTRAIVDYKKKGDRTTSRMTLIKMEQDEDFLTKRHIYRTLRIKVPIFVARQLDKHQVGFVKNEISRRYVSSSPEFFKPELWRGKAENKKQGSSSETIPFIPAKDGYFYDEFCEEIYRSGLTQNVCEEQTRMVLPQSMYTEYFLTANLEAWDRLLSLRLKEDTQKETRDVAKLIEVALYGED